MPGVQAEADVRAIGKGVHQRGEVLLSLHVLKAECNARPVSRFHYTAEVVDADPVGRMIPESYERVQNHDRDAVASAVGRTGDQIIADMLCGVTRFPHPVDFAERCMSVATSEDEFEFEFGLAQRESANAFGDDTMYIERYIEKPRHVEIQIMADDFGHVVALGDRDCSVQRNHQKLIEESPSPAINDETRAEMNRCAILAAKTVQYTNAGTIEFIVDPQGHFYFMEMNTRIQVEHGVTEMVTGTDLIIEQIRVAAGEPLSFTEEDVKPRGHAIECRINAEIPAKNFMPSPGVVKHLHLPAGNGVRVDTGLYTGYRIPSEYDSMIAKVIVHAPTREAALMKMRSALNEMLVVGVETNLDFQYQIIKHPVFAEGKADTGFIEDIMHLT